MQHVLRCWNCNVSTFVGEINQKHEDVVKASKQAGWTRESGWAGELSRCPECQGKPYKLLQKRTRTK